MCVLHQALADARRIRNENDILEDKLEVYKELYSSTSDKLGSLHGALAKCFSQKACAGEVPPPDAIQELRAFYDRLPTPGGNKKKKRKIEEVAQSIRADESMRNLKYVLRMVERLERVAAP